MRIKYELYDMPLLQQSKCMSDLMKYYGEQKFKLMEQVSAISRDKMISAKLLNTIRNHSGMAGMTIDSFINGLTQASNIDVFSFKVNGIDPCEIFQKNDLVLEVYMNPVYFATKASLAVAMPGFRKHKAPDMESRINDIAHKEQDKWERWFDKELNNYHTMKRTKKFIVEK